MAEHYHLSHDDYRLAWICALPIELAAAKAMFDEIHPLLPSASDTISYTAGKIAGHNVVMACLPKGSYATISATAVVSNIKSMFPNVQYGLMVGIAGAAPSDTADIRLGDVVISKPTDDLGGVVQYDLGKTVGDGQFQRTGMLNQPPNVLLTAVSEMDAESMTSPESISTILADIFSRFPAMKDGFSRPLSEDRLYHAKHPSEQIVRESRNSNDPQVHYGIVASGNRVIKHAPTRDAIARDSNALCFEMEAAGIMNHLPSLVIRGMCDYCDSHKNKEWQGYAALVAAIYAKRLLSFVPVQRSMNRNTTKGIYDENTHKTHTVYEIDQFCLDALRCPDSRDVKIRLKQAKDKLLRPSFEWILEDSDYAKWQYTAEVCLLWIKGGAGKGKTMMAIGLIEELSSIRHEPTVVAYSFCQNADSNLNTLESIIKGLIFQLVIQETTLMDCIRRFWDSGYHRFKKDLTAWRNLWDILIDMLEGCQSKVFLVVDALDECQDHGIADFLKCIVRNGLDQPAKVKWILTSRPLDDAERELLAGCDQVQVSFELNSIHVAKAVENYISHRVRELSRRHCYSDILSVQLEREISDRAQGTFLWVSLVCKRLESVSRENTLAMVQELPPGLHPFFDRALTQLSQGASDDVFGCTRLLKTMMLVYRPLRIEEIPSVSGFTAEVKLVKAWVNRCASFLNMQGDSIEFVHQSARDYLAGANGNSPLNPYEPFGHDEIVQSCLNYLHGHLKVNLLNLPEPDFTRDQWRESIDHERSTRLSSVDYAATFWIQHLQNATEMTTSTEKIIEKTGVHDFLHDRLLEWLECLSLLDELQRAVSGIEALEIITKSNLSTLAITQDARRFILRNYALLNRWPLQVYSAGIIFSPESSVVKRANAVKVPAYISQVPAMEDRWDSMIQVLDRGEAHSNKAEFSPDGKQIAAAYHDGIIGLWSSHTGELQMTLECRKPRTNVRMNGWKYVSERYDIFTFSSTGKLATAGTDETMNAVSVVKIWNPKTGELLRQLKDVPGQIISVTFSPDSSQIALHSCKGAVGLWETITGEPHMTFSRALEENSHPNEAGLDTVHYQSDLTFSPDGKQIASQWLHCYIWDASTGELQTTLKTDDKKRIEMMKYSPDGKYISCGTKTSPWIRHGNKVKLWNAATGRIQRELKGTMPFAFSPDSRQVASSSVNSPLIYFEDVITGEISQTLHCEGEDGSDIKEVKFSPDGRKIATISGLKGNPGVWVVQLWDTRTGILQQTINDCTEGDKDIAFSPDGRRIARCKRFQVIQIWETVNDLNPIVFERHLNPVGGLEVSTDSMLVASTSRSYLDHSCIKIWDATTGNLQKTFQALKDESKITHLKFSPDNMRVASGHSRWAPSHRSGLDLWDVSTGRILRTLQAPRYFPSDSEYSYRIVFSSNGQMVASAYERSYWSFSFRGPLFLTIRVWNSISGTLQKTLRGHRDEVTAISFSPDNKKLASASKDCTIRVWDISTPDTGFNFFAPLRSFFGSRASRIIKTSEPVHHLQFSTCHNYLRTEIGQIGLGLKKKEFDSRSLNLTQDLSVNPKWICYRKKPFLWLPVEFRPIVDFISREIQSVVRDDMVIIGTESGRVLVFRFDRSALQSLFAHSTDERE